MAECPVCGMDVDEEDPTAETEYEGTAYKFCGVGCQEDFQEYPGCPFHYRFIDSQPHWTRLIATTREYLL